MYNTQRHFVTITNHYVYFYTITVVILSHQNMSVGMRRVFSAYMGACVRLQGASVMGAVQLRKLRSLIYIPHHYLNAYYRPVRPVWK